MRDNDKQNNIVGVESGEQASTVSKIRAFIAGLTPGMIFRHTFFTSVLIALAAGIIYHTATDSLHVNVNKVETTTVVLSGSDDIGGIESGGYKAVEWSVKNESTSPAYVFIRIKEATGGLYEVVDTSGWCELTDVEKDDEIILGYGESSGLTTVAIGDESAFTGRLHCLADVEQYSYLTGDDMNIEVEGCLVYATGENGENVGYDTSAGSLWQAYVDNR